MCMYILLSRKAPVQLELNSIGVWWALIKILFILKCNTFLWRCMLYYAIYLYLVFFGRSIYVSSIPFFSQSFALFYWHNPAQFRDRRWLSDHTTECQWVTHETIPQYISWTWKLTIFSYLISNLVHCSDLNQIMLTFPSASQLYFQLLHMAPCQIAQKYYMSKHWALYQRTLYGSYEHNCIKWE